MRLVSLDDRAAPPEQRGLFGLLDDEGATLAVGTLEVDGDPAVPFEPGWTFGVSFKVQGGITA